MSEGGPPSKRHPASLSFEQFCKFCLKNPFALLIGIPLHIFDRGKKAEHGDEEEDHGQ